MRHTCKSVNTIRIALSVGEPAGIGPDIVLQLIQKPRHYGLLAVACPQMLAARAQQLKLPVKLHIQDAADQPLSCKPGELSVQAVPTAEKVTAQILNKANADYVVRCLDLACDLCLAKHYDALVTGPIHKGHLNNAHIPFSGHTEHLAKRCNSKPVMLLSSDDIKVALVTTHIPLAQVAKDINPARISHCLHVLHHFLINSLGIAKPCIAVCGLNPHAGDDGAIGTEEQTMINPLLQQLRQTEDMDLIGTMAADTIFIRPEGRRADAILAMYHDQALPLLKYISFGKAVNISMGLGIIRTSVDHGTALDRAGTADSDADSLVQAIALATQLVARQRTASNLKTGAI